MFRQIVVAVFNEAFGGETPPLQNNSQPLERVTNRL